jgi:nucleoside-diphosphate-sugar epimerase
MSRAKTLVTGATGMTGSHTVQLLLKRGHTVRVLAHNEDDRSMRLQELVFYGSARVTEGGAVDLLQRLARIYLGPNAEYPPAAMRNIPG